MEHCHCKLERSINVRSVQTSSRGRRQGNGQNFFTGSVAHWALTCKCLMFKTVEQDAPFWISQVLPSVPSGQTQTNLFSCDRSTHDPLSWHWLVNKLTIELATSRSDCAALNTAPHYPHHKWLVPLQAAELHIPFWFWQMLPSLPEG